MRAWTPRDGGALAGLSVARWLAGIALIASAPAGCVADGAPFTYPGTQDYPALTGGSSSGAPEPSWALPQADALLLELPDVAPPPDVADVEDARAPDGGDSSEVDAGPVAPCLTREALEGGTLGALGSVDFTSMFDLGPFYDYLGAGACPGQVWCADFLGTTPFSVNVELAVIAFQDGCEPVYAHAIVDRDHAEGRLSAIDEENLTVDDVQFRAWDQGRFDGAIYSAEDGSVVQVVPWEGAWARGTAMNQVAAAELDFLVPNPGRWFQLMVGVMTMKALDDGVLETTDTVSHGQWTGSVDEALRSMLHTDDDSRTSALIKRLHTLEYLTDDADNPSNDAMASLGLSTLQLTGTLPSGTWPTVDGAIRMTAWDVARLLWLVSPDLPVPTWKVGKSDTVDTAFLSEAYKQYLADLLGGHCRHDVLSSTSLCGFAGAAPGIPASLPDANVVDGAAVCGDDSLSLDVGPCQDAAEVTMAHKTARDHNTVAHAAVVRDDAPGGRKYVVALLSNAGERYTSAALGASVAEGGVAPCLDPGMCISPDFAKLGASLDAFLAGWLEGGGE